MVDMEGNFMQGGTLNIGAGCDIVNECCSRCYAMGVTAGLDTKMKGTALRMVESGGDPSRAEELREMYEGITKVVNGTAVWSGKITAFPNRVDDFLRKTKPQSWFACSLTDFWHDGYSDDYLATWYAAFGISPNQRVYVLTKRPARQTEFLSTKRDLIMEKAEGLLKLYRNLGHLSAPAKWPFENVWNGASAGTQKTLEGVLPDLLATPSVMQWLSLEPLIGKLDLAGAMAQYSEKERRLLKWAIFGGESGPKARPMDLKWVRDGIRDCRALGIAPFFKQKGEVTARSMGCHDKKGGDPSEWPEDIRVREYPVIAG